MSSHLYKRVCPSVRPSVCPSVRMSVTITGKPPKSAQNSRKTLRLYTEPLRTHLRICPPGLVSSMMAPATHNFFGFLAKSFLLPLWLFLLSLFLLTTYVVLHPKNWMFFLLGLCLVLPSSIITDGSM